MSTLDEVSISGLSGLRRLLWSGVWLVFLAYPIGDILARHHSIGWLAAAWVSLAVFVALYLRTMWSAFRPETHAAPSRVRWLAVLIAFTFGMVIAFGPAWAGLIIYLGVATGWTLSNRAAAATLAGIAAAIIAAGVASGTGASELAFVVFLTTALGFSMLGIRHMVRVIVELHNAKDEIARLTASEERLRFARDLHDVLGHSLSVIALKSQVARRTMGQDPDAAANAIADIETVTRQSLADVRELVSGYRQRSLAEEMAAADELLLAAGIESVIDRPPELTDDTVDQLLAWALREGTTNVIRHSHASRCRITVATDEHEARLEIADDGNGGGPDPAADGDPSSGSGLRGLRERMGQVGGQIDAGPQAGGGFRLAVTVPR